MLQYQNLVYISNFLLGTLNFSEIILLLVGYIFVSQKSIGNNKTKTKKTVLNLKLLLNCQIQVLICTKKTFFFVHYHYVGCNFNKSLFYFKLEMLQWIFAKYTYSILPKR